MAAACVFVGARNTNCAWGFSVRTAVCVQCVCVCSLCACVHVHVCRASGKNSKFACVW